MPRTEFYPDTSVLHANFLRSGRKKPYRSQGGNSEQVDWLGVFLQSNNPVTGGGPALGQQSGSRRNRLLIQVSEYLPDHHRVFETGNEVQCRQRIFRYSHFC